MRVRGASELKPAAPVEYLAHRRIPRGAPTVLVGGEGIGKSLLWVAVVGAYTTGKAWPGFGIPEREPGHALLVLTEDDWSTAVLPRLELAGADLDRVSVLCESDDGSGSPVFPFHMRLVEEADPKPGLIVVDAWLDTVSAGLSVRDPQQARRALHPWKETATSTGAAVLLLTHTNRIASGNVRDLYGATGALRQKARMTLFAQRDEDGHLLVGPDKANVTGTDVPATKFSIDAVQVFPPTDDTDGTVPILRYVGESTKTAGQHVSDNYDAEHGDDEQDRTDAETWLRMYLESNPGELSGEIKAKAKAAGFSERTLQRARKKQRVVVEYEKQAAGGPVSRWSLPADQERDQSGCIPDGTSGEGGINAGQPPMPPCAKSDEWHKAAQGHDQHEQALVPVVPLTGEQGPHEHSLAPPGGLTPDSPGQTDRVLAAVAKARGEGQQEDFSCRCGEQLLADNNSGLCAECRCFAPQEVVAQQIGRLGGAAS
ncbi:AAA family ATPase [Mycobacterium sp. ITM-2016-00318]|uniref:AAA family ATPase n=1 Tax=Mycobacterium sp. ITM-2016-00318 TaxID=2099693 RepID=UPI000CF8B1C4|nr:AAA family ATPase [Mycobacterium sp. ITM-2016-00318]WNG95663.1 AAA family ATPase [Mycobacterium sp. ITM-2016-00318]